MERKMQMYYLPYMCLSAYFPPTFFGPCRRSPLSPPPPSQSTVRLLNSQVRLLDHAKHVRFMMLRGAGTHLCGGADLRCVVWRGAQSEGERRG